MAGNRLSTRFQGKLLTGSSCRGERHYLCSQEWYQPRWNNALYHAVSLSFLRPSDFFVRCPENDLQAFLCGIRSEEHTSELQSLMRISYAVFCLKKKN